MIPIVNLKAKARLSETSSRAFPLASYPEINNVSDVAKLIDYLDVEKSPRYRPTPSATFCNIYAYDYATAFGAYLPRVWWTEQALKDKKFISEYGVTVRELNVNALYEWFPKYASQFGWQKIDSINKAQLLANSGKCVVALAANLKASSSGHIVAIVPENGTNKATYANGLCDKVCMVPLQSNAGRTNKKYFVSEWWKKNHKPLIIYVYNG